MTFRSGCSPAFYRTVILKNFKSHKKVMESFFDIKNFKTVMFSFFSIKNFKSRIAVMEFFLSFRSCKSRKKMTESLFSGHALLSFHMMHKFPGTMFSLSAPTEFLWLYISFFGYYISLTIFLWLYILISMKKDAVHISVNTVRVAFLRQKWMVLRT